MAGGSKSVRPWSSRLASCLLWAVVGVAGISTCYWLLWEGVYEWRDEKRWHNFPMHLRDGCDSHMTLDACQLRQVIYLWAPTAAAALAAIPLISMGAHLRISRHPLLSRQLPPRCFWASWCGGMSVADALVVLFWLGVNGTWMGWMMYRYEKLAPMFEKRTSPFHVQWILVSIALGQLLTPNLVLLFYPVTRGSVLLQLTGISYPNAIRYHRWLGHATLVFATAHSLGFWGLWLWEQTFLKEAFEQGARINNLMGGLSFISALSLWLTSLEAARRWNYDLFYKMHHVGFWGFMLLGCMHYSALFWAFLPGLMLYAVDAVYRLSQVTGAKSTVLDAQASEDAHVASLTLASPAWGVAPTGYVWVNAPGISGTEWHPFEYVCVESHSQEHPTALAIHTKAYSRWTKKFVALVQQQGLSIQVRMEGPYPELPPQDLVGNKRGIVMVAGGIGITAALSVFKELGHHNSGHTSSSAEKSGGVNLPPVLLVWAARNASELTLLAPKVAQIAEEAGINMQVHVYFTGPADELQHIATDGTAQHSHTGPANGMPNGTELGQSPRHFLLEWSNGTSPTPSHNHTTSHASPGPAAASIHDSAAANGCVSNGCAPAAHVSNGGASACVMNGVSASVCVDTGVVGKGAVSKPTPLCPVLPFASIAQQAAHKIQIHAIVFAGALVALLWVRAVGSVHVLKEWPTAWLGAGYVVGVTVCTVVPGLIVLGGWRLAYNRVVAVTVGGKKGGARAGRSGNGTLPEQEPLLGDSERGEAERERERGEMDRESGEAERGRGEADGERVGEEDSLSAAKPGGSACVRAVSGRGDGMTPGAGERSSVQGQYRWHVNLGRPPLEQIVRGWVNHLEQLPGRGEEAEVVQVYGMGPEALVLATQLLCDDVNRAAVGEGWGRLKLVFERKTFDL